MSNSPFEPQVMEPRAAPSATDNATPSEERTPELIDRVLADVQERLEQQRLPTATYRVQLNRDCTFRQVEAVVPYFFTLGISDLYTSPFLQARLGSRHGYDIVDHGRINAEIGTADDLRSLRSALQERGMGLIADAVPNHMAADAQQNLWWQDVLENGASSSYASYFDIDWMPLKPDLADKVLLPVLGDQFGHVLEAGQLAVRYGEGTFWLEYFDQRFPLCPRSYAILLMHNLEAFQHRLGETHADVLELLSILTAIKNLPHHTETDVERIVERRREKEVIKRRLHELIQRSAETAQFVADNLRHVNGERGHPRSFDALDELLQHQAYRLAYWRVAADEINYRRFFDINELAAICTELPQVFAESHQLLFEYLQEGTITGLRIDHPDGLYDPRGYFAALQQRRFLQLCRQSLSNIRQSGRETAEDAPAELEQRLLDLWAPTLTIAGSPLGRPLYMVIEKILAPGEPLPADWPVHGTVGYDFLNMVNNLFVFRASEPAFSSMYARFTKESLDFAELEYHCKRLIVRMSMASELSVLAYRLDRISERNRLTRDFTLQSLMRALQEVIASFQVYRSYVQAGVLLERDRRYIEAAVAMAKRRNPAMSASIFDFVRDALLLRFREHADEEEKRSMINFVGKFQQLTGPIMAKSTEDTAFYRFNRLVSLNEVGGEPARFGTTVEEFHAMNMDRVPRLSHSWNATSTHDTKRSEDVRARINVLSEIPDLFRKHVQQWRRWNQGLKTIVDGVETPSRNAEFLLYQTVIGAWPDDIAEERARNHYVSRLQQHLQKVEREAKLHTSWISPNEPYETAVSQFVSDLFDPRRRQPFVSHVQEFAAQVADHGRWNSLSQLILKIASPGVPDFYQGCELWNLTLVDPDNRHAVDFDDRRQILNGLLAQMAQALGTSSDVDVVDEWLNAAADGPANPAVLDLIHDLLRTRRTGVIKLFCMLLGLRARRKYADVFEGGTYTPLAVSGKCADHLIAFHRQVEGRDLVVVVPRFTVSLTGFGGPAPLGELWENTQVQLPQSCLPGPLRNLFTRETLIPSHHNGVLSASQLLHRFPVSILASRRN